MKKLNPIVIAALIAAVFVGCTTTNGGGGTSGGGGGGSSGQAQSNAASTAPDWLDELPPEDALWGIGIAKLQNDSLALKSATARAQRDVAQQLSVLVQGMLTDYSREAGTLNNSTSIQFIEDIGRQIQNANLSGAAPNARKRMPDGTWWLRVAINKGDAAKAVHDVIDNEAAQFAEWKAQEALKNLDYQLSKTQSKPTVVSED